jgi:hypothetical protein
MSQEALDKVKGPALGIKITAGLGIAYCIFNLILVLLGVEIPVLAQEPPEGMEWLTAVGIASSLVGIAVGAFLWIAAGKMARCQSYNLALAASIVAMVPCCSPCCLIGLPVGIWALVVLSKPEVKAAFAQG